MRLSPLGPGPVFVYEWLTTTRRWQLYALRSLFVSAVLIGITGMWFSQLNTTERIEPGVVSIADAARIGRILFDTIVAIELSLVLLAAAAATAGSICLDKARGTLDHMLTTDLSNSEIVLGKLGARLIPVVGLVFCVLPVTALIGLLGGVDPNVLLGSFLTVLGTAVLCCSLALLLSIWGRKTHEVLMLTYMLIIFWLIAPTIAMMIASAFLGDYFDQNSGSFLALYRSMMLSNPYFLLFNRDWRSGVTDTSVHGIFLVVCLIISAVGLAVATARVRTVALGQAGTTAAPQSSRFVRRKRFPRATFSSGRLGPLIHRFSPSLDGNPVLWREWHRARPTSMLRIAHAMYTSLGVICVALALSRTSQEVIANSIAFLVSVGLLLLSVSAATSLAEERVRGSLDVLLTTPISTRSILLGKWWGAFRQIRLPLFWAALLGLGLLAEGSLIGYLLMLALIFAQGAAIASVGLALATWLTRLGRAIAVCVSSFAGWSIGWAGFVVGLMGPDPGVMWILGSPPAGAIFAAENISGHMRRSVPSRVAVGIATVVWIVIFLLFAYAIFSKTVRTFDRHLGRISDENASKPSHRAHGSAATQTAAIAQSLQ